MNTALLITSNEKQHTISLVKKYKVLLSLKVSLFFLLQADIIVNTISDDMDLSKGAVSKALLQTAGHQLQSEISRAAPSSGLSYGDMVITAGYNLKCSKVFHVVCPFWHGGQSSPDKVRPDLPHSHFIHIFVS